MDNLPFCVNPHPPSYRSQMIKTHAKTYKGALFDISDTKYQCKSLDRGTRAAMPLPCSITENFPDIPLERSPHGLTFHRDWTKPNADKTGVTRVLPPKTPFGNRVTRHQTLKAILIKQNNQQ
ncbi:hypothetical protein [Desulfoluna spongiiphila]|uniref:hypothetical protein n=1 Tax=Desulfoluna spongiiphila TaxID=419481 RepID=UPI0011133752|nr:hypothetical protein [Desulfoluna spongiiphila]